MIYWMSRTQILPLKDWVTFFYLQIFECLNRNLYFRSCENTKKKTRKTSPSRRIRMILESDSCWKVLEHSDSTWSDRSVGRSVWPNWTVNNHVHLVTILFFGHEGFNLHNPESDGLGQLRWWRGILWWRGGTGRGALPNREEQQDNDRNLCLHVGRRNREHRTKSITWQRSTGFYFGEFFHVWEIFFDWNFEPVYSWLSDPNRIVHLRTQVIWRGTVLAPFGSNLWEAISHCNRHKFISLPFFLDWLLQDPAATLQEGVSKSRGMMELLVSRVKKLLPRMKQHWTALVFCRRTLTGNLWWLSSGCGFFLSSLSTLGVLGSEP